MGETWSRSRCEAVFQADVAKTEKALSRCVFRQLNPYQSGALVSLAYNVGTPKTCKSKLVAFINAGDFEAAAKEFPRWSYAGGKWLDGLFKRRKREQWLFVQPYTEADSSKTWTELKRAMTSDPGTTEGK